MNHCVGGYAEDCLHGTSTIWSMCQLAADGSRDGLTIEVQPGTQKIVQAQGFANRSPSSLEIEVLKQWGRSADLDWRPIETQEQYEALSRHAVLDARVAELARVWGVSIRGGHAAKKAAAE